MYLLLKLKSKIVCLCKKRLVMILFIIFLFLNVYCNLFGDVVLDNKVDLMLLTLPLFGLIFAFFQYVSKDDEEKYWGEQLNFHRMKWYVSVTEITFFFKVIFMYSIVFSFISETNITSVYNWICSIIYNIGFDFISYSKFELIVSALYVSSVLTLIFSYVVLIFRGMGYVSSSIRKNNIDEQLIRYDVEKEVVDEFYTIYTKKMRRFDFSNSVALFLNRLEEREVNNAFGVIIKHCCNRRCEALSLLLSLEKQNEEQTNILKRIVTHIKVLGIKYVHKIPMFSVASKNISGEYKYFHSIVLNKGEVFLNHIDNLDKLAIVKCFKDCDIAFSQVLELNYELNGLKHKVKFDDLHEISGWIFDFLYDYSEIDIADAFSNTSEYIFSANYIVLCKDVSKNEQCIPYSGQSEIRNRILQYNLIAKN